MAELSMAASQRFCIFFTAVVAVSLPLQIAALSSSSRRRTCNCVCGLGKSSSHGNIVGGVETRQHEFPWLVAIMRNDAFHCGGSLITYKHVLTAAHCVQGFDQSSLNVLLGEHDLNLPVGEERKVSKMTYHEEYDPSNFYNDIAVIELDSPVEFVTTIRPACIPTNKHKDYKNIMGTVTGWGRVGEVLDASDTVRKVDVKLMTREQCLKSSYKPSEIIETMICAGYRQGKKDACGGDSGGPLHIQEGKSEMEVVGVVSWGEGCGRANHPGVYTKVGDYLPWIESNIGKECLCPLESKKISRVSLKTRIDTPF